ncbi:MAG: hypothetical protein KAV87_58995 [Desulfobacteraceae bacterium]|nr:hypothetical protein [Desulfobacteraceae bacterium]
MELQQFITTAIKAIGKGIEEGREGNIIPGNVSSLAHSNGVEFDLGVKFDNDKITVEDRYDKGTAYVSRIKFSIPIMITRE